MSALDSLRAWLSTHQKQLIVGGVAAAGGYALYQRHLSTSSSATVPASSTDAAALSPDVAGLTTAPTAYDTTSTDTQSIADIVSGLSSIQSTLTSRLPVPAATTPKAPAPPPALPKPGARSYVIKKGDTLNKISQAVYGEVSARTIGLLRVTNPTLLTFSPTSSLNLFAGNKMYIAKAPDPNKKPAPKKPAPKKPVKKPAPKPPAKKK